MAVNREISEIINAILTEQKASVMRTDIVDGILKTYEDKSITGNANMEVSQARGIKQTLGDRLNSFDFELSQKIKKGNVSIADIDKNLGKIDQTYLTDELIGQIKGTAAVNPTPADDSLTTIKYVNKSVTNEKMAHVGLERNRTIDYPLIFGINGSISNISSNHEILKDGLLDIKIMNAEPDTEYGFRYLTKNQASFGNLILIEAVNNGAVRQLFNTVKRVYPIDANGITTLSLTADDGDEIVEITFDYSKITDGFIPGVNSNLNPFKNNYISKDKLFIKQTKKQFNNLVEFDKVANTLSVISKYGKEKDARFSFGGFGANKLMALYYVWWKENKQMNPKKATSGWNILAGTGSDWIGPYKVKAVANGDTGGKIYTGGSHSKNNSMVGEPTAETLKYDIFVDGKRLGLSGDYTGDKIDIHVKNKIMAYNTLTTNRYVIEETVKYSIIGSLINVEVSFNPLEEIIIEEYFGMQTINGNLDKVYYPLGQHSTEQPSNTNNDAGAKSDYFCDSVIISKTGTTDNWIAKMDNSQGLGRREFIPTTTPCVKTTTSGKSYMNLIVDNAIPFVSGERKNWVGKYDFINK